MGTLSRRLGLEFEMIHAKAIGDTSRSYPVTSSGTSLVNASPMNLVVQEFQMTHGLNFGLVNLVVRQPVGHETGRLAVVLRTGGGPIFPHGETTVNGRAIHRYQYAGLGGQVAAGVDLRLGYRTSALAEYKLTYCRPELESVGGSSSTTALSHHVSLGLTLALTAAR